MQLKCPGCSRTLKIPDSAAGKVVKCPCGKQLRAPGGQPRAGTPSQATGQPKPRPTTQKPRPTTQKPSRPSPQPSAFGGVDEMMFDELTDSDMQPVSVPQFAQAKPAQAASNPYASPAATDNSATSQNSGPYATQNLRLANFILDNVLYVASLFGVLIAVTAFRLFVGGVPGAAEPQAPPSPWIVQTIYLAYLLSYYALPEAIFGASPAKFLTGTRVISADGGKANFGQILVRTFARMIPFEPLSFVFGDKTTGWHDSLSKTRVITVRG